MLTRSPAVVCGRVMCNQFSSHLCEPSTVLSPRIVCQVQQASRCAKSFGLYGTLVVFWLVIREHLKAFKKALSPIGKNEAMRSAGSLPNWAIAQNAMPSAMQWKFKALSHIDVAKPVPGINNCADCQFESKTKCRAHSISPLSLSLTDLHG